MAECRLPAPAKLNLFLRVTGRRPDGYHELQTVFQLLDWGDEITLHPTDDGRIRRDVDVPGVGEEEDLSLRAAHALQSAARADGRPHGGVRLRLDKHIPLGAGLGGASSDAATVLLGLNRLWGCGFNVDELAELGLTLGSDVPVFVRGRSAGQCLSPGPAPALENDRVGCCGAGRIRHATTHRER